VARHLAELGFQLTDSPLQGLEFLAGAQQDRPLYLELLAGDQDQPGEAALEHAAELLERSDVGR